MLDTMFTFGNYLHLLAMIALLMKIWCTQDCSGVSVKSQFLYALVFTTGYLDLFTTYISTENTFLKIAFIVLTCCTLLSITLFFWKTYEKKYDTTRIEIFIIACMVIAFLVNHMFDYQEILWTFSVYLEAVAMVPQFQFVTKAKRIHKHMIFYIASIAIYEGLYISHWGYQYYYYGQYDKLRVASGVVQFLLYCDFFLRILPWLCTRRDDDQQTLATVETHVEKGIPKAGHLTSNVSTIMLTPASLTGVSNDKVNLLTNEETLEKY